ncbi:MAG: hypothetical protein WDO13_04795 [Verrucomicrobiota bacterium]
MARLPQAFHPVRGWLRTVLRPKNRELCRLERGSSRPAARSA